MVEKMRYLQSYQARQAGGSDGAYHVVQVDSDGIPQPKVPLLMPTAEQCLCSGSGDPTFMHSIACHYVQGMSCRTAIYEQSTLLLQSLLQHNNVFAERRICRGIGCSAAPCTSTSGHRLSVLRRMRCRPRRQACAPGVPQSAAPALALPRRMMRRRRTQRLSGGTSRHALPSFTLFFFVLLAATACCAHEDTIVVKK